MPSFNLKLILVLVSIGALTSSLIYAQDVSISGVQNCVNKCEKMLNMTQYSIDAQGSRRNTYEFDACAVGCAICDRQLDRENSKPEDCFVTCKNTNWNQALDPESGEPMVIQKGVLEPDKACEIGCIINTCQVVCEGGTPEHNNVLTWEGVVGGGCSIKTGAIRPDGFYSQNAKYSFWNTFAGQGGQNECCSNSVSLCYYRGNKNSENYRNVLHIARKYCNNVGPLTKQSSANEICTWFRGEGLCGDLLNADDI
jgi:hypothetical protein